MYAYPSGSELAFVHGNLVLGQDASVRASIDVAAGVMPALASVPVYQRAAATEPADRALDAYASVAGVRRLLAPRGGIVGALGELLYQPALQGVTLAVSPTADGARVQIHSALDPALSRLSSPAPAAFAPTLQDVMPAGSLLMLDVSRLDRIAPQVFGAASTAQIAGALGPLLARLGRALAADGANVASLISIFDHEAAVAIVPGRAAPTLLIVARAPDQAAVQTELAHVQIPLAQLFRHRPAAPAAFRVQRPPDRRGDRPSAGPGQWARARLRRVQRPGGDLDQPVRARRGGDADPRPSPAILRFSSR